MPDSAGNIEEIHNSLKASLGGGRSSLDDDIAAGTKRVLLHNIEFEPASKPYSVQRDELRVKYNPIMNTGPMQSKGWGPRTPIQHQATSSANSQSEKNGDILPSPRVVLYPEEKIKMEWSHMTRIGAGLINLGNTCFFNSTLQCLTYTAPLVNYCYTSDHKEKCRKKDFCMMCEIQKHIRVSLNSGGRPIKPHSILQKLRCIAKHMKWGRQEDAHEFLRFVVDHLQQACMNSESNKLDRFSKETTVINQIFGGYLRSQVTCLKCQGKSNTFDPFMDLSLDIKGVSSVEEALAKYVKPETLDFDNAYMCPKCKTKVRAQKRFSIQKPPNILTLQLNRFDFNRHLAGKMTKFIRYDEKINLRNYMSQRQGEPVLYHLYGVIVHSGYSSDHGHYYSYVKSATKTWFCMNDASVNQANMNTVFSADAYVLFYARINKGNSGNSTPSTPNSIHAKSPAATLKGPYSNSGSNNHVKHERSPMVNGIHGKPSSELGTPIKRDVPTPSPKIVPHATSATALPGSHGKISFPILTAQQRKQQQQQQLDGKRIVLQIKDGNSTTMEKSPDGKSKLVNGGRDRPLGCLVPYRDDDSDSEQENNSAASFRLQPHAAGDGPGKPQGAGKKTNGHLPSHSGDADGSKPPSIKSRPVTDQAGRMSPKKLPSSSIPTSSSDTPSWGKGGADAGKGPPCAGKGAGRLSPLALTPVVSGTASTVVQATSSSWCVQPQDPVPSPRGSCSSTNSVNSTTEWHVEGKERVSTGGKPPSSKPNLDSRHNLARKLFTTTSTSPHAKVESRLCQNGSGQESSSAKQTVGRDELPRSHTPVDVSDRQALLSPCSSETSSRKAKKHKKKHKKKWKDSQSSKDSQEDSSSRSDSSHKKKKHKRRKEEKLNRSWDEDSDSSSEAEHHRQHKKKRKSEDSEEYVWVERKVSPSPKHKHKISNKVVEQRWNGLTSDDVALRKSEDKVKGRASWDGSRSAKVSSYLGSSQYGLGAVQSWEGGHSHMGDQSADTKKRHWADDYNDAIDSGKVKKVKKHREDDGFSNHNPFQNHYTPKRHHWNDDHSYHAPPKPVRYRDQPWLNSDFDPRPYQIKASSHY